MTKQSQTTSNFIINKELNSFSAIDETPFDLMLSNEAFANQSLFSHYNLLNLQPASQALDEQRAEDEPSELVEPPSNFEVALSSDENEFASIESFQGGGVGADLGVNSDNSLLKLDLALLTNLIDTKPLEEIIHSVFPAIDDFSNMFVDGTWSRFFEGGKPIEDSILDYGDLILQLPITSFFGEENIFQDVKTFLMDNSIIKSFSSEAITNALHNLEHVDGNLPIISHTDLFLV